MTRTLESPPNLEQLKKQAKDLQKEHEGKSSDSALRIQSHHPEFSKLSLDSIQQSSFTLADAQLTLAREYRFASWQKLKSYVESFPLHGKLKAAINANDVVQVKAMLQTNLELLQAPIGYGGGGPLVWAAECRVPRSAPSRERLEIVQFLIDFGADVHENGDCALMRAALVDERIPMMEILVANGAAVNGKVGGKYPVIHGSCECLAPLALKWLLDHGADPNATDASDQNPFTPLDMAIGTYDRNPKQRELVNALIEAGGVSKFSEFPSIFIHRGRLDLLKEALEKDSTLVHRRFPELDYGATGARSLDLKGATLLHVAADYGDAEAIRLLLEHGADVNAPALIDERGVGGQTPIFHSATQFWDFGKEATKLLIERGANLSVRAKVPSYYEKPGEFLVVTPLGYSARFPCRLTEHGASEHSGTLNLLVESGAVAGDVYSAALLGLVDELRTLLASGGDPNESHPLGESALAAALSKEHIEIVRMLRAAGARE